MPRIKRWAPISHDINRDPEFQDLRRQHGDWLGLVWLEMLFIADRNDGEVKGTWEQIASTMAPLSLGNRPTTASKRIMNALAFMEECGWIETRTDHVLVTKYAEYHKTRGKNKSHAEDKQSPSEPNLTKPNQGDPLVAPRKRGEPVSTKPKNLPLGITDQDWKDFEEMATESSKTHDEQSPRRLFAKTLCELEDEGQDPRACLLKAIERSWLGLDHLKGSNNRNSGRRKGPIPVEEILGWGPRQGGIMTREEFKQGVRRAGEILHLLTGQGGPVPLGDLLAHVPAYRLRAVHRGGQGGDPDVQVLPVGGRDCGHSCSRQRRSESTVTPGRNGGCPGASSFRGSTERRRSRLPGARPAGCAGFLREVSHDIHKHPGIRDGSLLWPDGN